MARLARAIQGRKHWCILPWMAHVKWAMTGWEDCVQGCRPADPGYLQRAV